MLGLAELEKLATPTGKGGLWLALLDGRRHLGEQPFRPNKKAHPAFLVADPVRLAYILGEKGYPAAWDNALVPRRRFYVEDSFRNRIELLEA